MSGDTLGGSRGSKTKGNYKVSHKNQGRQCGKPSEALLSNTIEQACIRLLVVKDRVQNLQLVRCLLTSIEASHQKVQRCVEVVLALGMRVVVRGWGKYDYE